MGDSRDFYGGVPSDINQMVSIKVDNLARKTDLAELDRIFRRYGTIGDIYMPRDGRTGKTRGFAFVRFYSTKHGDRAIREMDGRKIDGQIITVTWARGERSFRRDARGGEERRRRRGSTRSRSRSSSRSRGRSR